MWYFYILECSDGSFYTGVTADYEKRLEKHNLGKASVYTKKRRPVVLKYVEDYKIKSKALRREAEVKDFDRARKETIINTGRGIKFN